MPKYVVNTSGEWRYGSKPEQVAKHGDTVELSKEEAERVAGLHAQGIVTVSLLEEKSGEAVKAPKGTPTPALDNPPV